MGKQKGNNYDIAIVGAGAAGMTAAISAARSGAKVVLIEHMDRVGKKILATGNGKCNYTNEDQELERYRGDHPEFILPVMEQFGFEKTVAFFRELGVYPKVKNGYYYPASEQAASVLDVLRMELDYLNVSIFLECEIKKIAKKENFFVTDTNQGQITSKKLLFSTGLKASPKTGSDGSAIPYIEKFGHHFKDIVPALVQLQGKQPFFKTLAGIRAEINANLYINDAYVTSEKGELQLTDYGVSGIPIFQLSRFASKALKRNEHVKILLDFAPQLSGKEMFRLLEERMHQNGRNKTAAEALVGLFNRKLIDVLLKETQIPAAKKAISVSKDEISRLGKKIKEFRVDIIGTKSFEQAQVCAGGVATEEVHPQTLESKLVKGLYFAGEVLDIDGTCGGYNLQWAWSSGYVAGRQAALACQS